MIPRGLVLKPLAREDHYEISIWQVLPSSSSLACSNFLGYLTIVMTVGSIKEVYSRRELRQSERRDAILDVAHAAFLAHGHAGTSMSGIAMELGGSKTTLWTYFPTKQSLFAAVVLRAANALEGQLLASLDLNAGIEQSVRHFCDAYVQIICSPESIALHRLVIAEGARFPEIGQTFFDYAIGNIQQILIAFLGEADRLGMRRIPDPLSAADLLRSLCHGNSFQSQIFNVAGSTHATVRNEDGNVAATAFLQMFAPARAAHRAHLDSRKSTKPVNHHC